DRQGQGHRLRQPEGRRRQDHHHAEPRGGLRRGGASRAVRRHGSAGQSDDVAGHRSRGPGLVDVRRAGQRPADPRRHPAPRDRHRALLDRPRRSRDGDVDEDRPRALAGEGAARRLGGLRLHLHRYAAVAGTIDRQRIDRRSPGDRAGPVRVPVDARIAAAPEHARDDPGEPEPRGGDRGHPADARRHAHAARPRGARAARGELRRPDVRHPHQEDGALRGGPRAGDVGAQVRTQRDGGRRVSRAGQGGALRWQAI
ncbi:MAG: Chromosome (plasmid) partitioning protein ParA, partial [uncultured Solirubrobacteraceae bacterium]